MVARLNNNFCVTRLEERERKRENYLKKRKIRYLNKSKPASENINRI